MEMSHLAEQSAARHSVQAQPVPTGLVDISEFLLSLKMLRSLVVVFALSGTTVGGMYAFLYPHFATNVAVEASRDSLLVLQEAKAINLALMNIFSQSRMVRTYSEAFFASIDGLAKDGSELAASATQTKAYFRELAGGYGLSHSKTPEVQALELYMRKNMVEQLKTQTTIGSQGFSYQLESNGLTSYRIAFRASQKGMAPAIIVATVASFNEVAKRYNKAEANLQDQAAQQTRERVNIKFENLSNSLIANQARLEQRNLKLASAFYQLDYRIKQFEKANGLDAEKATAINAIDIFSNPKGNEMVSVSSFSERFELVEIRSAIKRITALQERRAVTLEEGTKLLDELKELLITKSRVRIESIAAMDELEAARGRLGSQGTEKDGDHKEALSIPLMYLEESTVYFPPRLNGVLDSRPIGMWQGSLGGCLLGLIASVPVIIATATLRKRKASLP